MTTTITAISTHDIRFPTSRMLDGSDALHPDPDYSMAYVILHTNRPDGIEGHGFTFTIGRGNDLCCLAIQSLGALVTGCTLESITANMGQLWRTLASDSQLRWVGPEKGVIHLAMAALINALWDLWGKVAGKPVWKLIVDMTPEELVRCIDFRYITDCLTPDEARDILRRNERSKEKRQVEVERDGYPAYITSAGWLGYSDEKLRQKCQEALAAGWSHFKMKVGLSADDDVRRCRIIREEIGGKRKFMVDANQAWDVDEAIRWIGRLAPFDPWWVEEPTSPDDVLGHARIARSVAPVRIATGEHAANRVIFKQLLQSQAISVCQLDSCRLGGVNEVLAVMLMAAKFGVPVCPHAGGAGLCEYVQHLSIVDYIAISGSLENRVCEYAEHLHEHFADPVVVRNGRYLVPWSPGYSAMLRPESLRRFRFSDGEEWAAVDQV